MKNEYIGDICDHERFFASQEADGTFKALVILCALKDGTIFENERQCDSTRAECMLLRAYIDVMANRKK